VNIGARVTNLAGRQIEPTSRAYIRQPLDRIGSYVTTKVINIIMSGQWNR